MSEPHWGSECGARGAHDKRNIAEIADRIVAKDQTLGGALARCARNEKKHPTGNM
jgi:hypothetical protein